LGVVVVDLVLGLVLGLVSVLLGLTRRGDRCCCG
jgi:hypothetical protein